VAGVILDSSIIIAAERRGQTVRQILEHIRASQGDIEIGVSVVAIAELVHGAYRAKTPVRPVRSDAWPMSGPDTSWQTAKTDTSSVAWSAVA
jgi:predicted nucleic acid-binding protein